MAVAIDWEARYKMTASLIYTFRKERGLSQDDMARLLDMSTGGYRKLEKSGRISFETYTVLRKQYGRETIDGIFFPEEVERAS